MTARSKWAPGACAIVVVDVQNDFCHSDGTLSRSGADVSAAQAMVPRLEVLLEGARAADVPIVWVQTWRDGSTDSVVWRSRCSDQLDAPPQEQPVRNCLRGTWGAEFYGIAPLPGEPIVHKIRYSAFVGTDLETVLRTLGRPSLLLTGVTTNVCVESTLRDAVFHEFHASLVEDCCAATSPAEHRSAVDNVRKYFGRVVTSEALRELWRRTGAD